MMRWAAVAAWLVACGPGEEPPVVLDPNSPAAYARDCAEALGPIPGFDCETEAVEIPVTVDGKPVDVEVELCDRPNLLERSCVPGSRVGKKAGETEDVTFVFVCRALDDRRDVPYDDIALIGYNAETGATCYFQSLPETPVTSVPSPMDDVDASVWLSREETADAACNICHLPDPYLHSPWIDQVRDPVDPSEPLVPNNPGYAPYFIAGGPEFDRWRLEHYALEDNACAQCHPIGRSAVFLDPTESDELPLTTTGLSWPMSTWMPPNYEGTEQEWHDTYSRDVSLIRNCFRQNFPTPPNCFRRALP